MDEQFDRWFQGSAVVDEDGAPQVMFHATSRDFDAFDRKASSRWRRQSMDSVGIWFSDNPSDQGGAGMYASGPGARIIPVFLRIARPKVYVTFGDFLREMHEAEGRRFEEQTTPGLGSPEGLRLKLVAQGYDGIAFQRTDNEALHEEVQALSDAVRRARDEEWHAPRSQREIFTAKRVRIEESLKRVSQELQAMGGSTELDRQYVWVAFEPEQVMFAVGTQAYVHVMSQTRSLDEGFIPRERSSV